jgi:uncharacterized membrane protein YjfL (UPF0719 family)
MAPHAFLVHLFAQTPSQSLAPSTWHDGSLGMALFGTLVFGLLGIFLAIIGFKIFDWVTPGHLGKEILEKQNMAAAIIAGAVVIGICIIVSRAIS